MPNMIEDASSIYGKIGSLMKYEPETPSKNHLWKEQVLGIDQLAEIQKDDDDDFDEEEEDEEEKDEL